MTTNKFKYTVHNCLEDIVEQLVKKRQATVEDLCDCSRCTLDISAIVLNQVKPQYCKVEIDVENMDLELLDDIERKISEAVGQVILHPNHDSGSKQGDYRVQNLSESLVEQILFEYLEEKNLLHVSTEQLDVIVAMVLNQVEPRYAVTGRGGAYKRLAGLELQFAPSIMVMTNNVLKSLEAKGVL